MWPDFLLYKSQTNQGNMVNVCSLNCHFYYHIGSSWMWSQVLWNFFSDMPRKSQAVWTGQCHMFRAIGLASRRPSCEVHDMLDLKFPIAAIILSVLLNILLATLLVRRLLWLGHRYRQAFGKSSEINTYISPATMIVESAVLYTASQLIQSMMFVIYITDASYWIPASLSDVTVVSSSGFAIKKIWAKPYSSDDCTIANLIQSTYRPASHYRGHSRTWWVHDYASMPRPRNRSDWWTRRDDWGSGYWAFWHAGTKRYCYWCFKTFSSLGHKQ